MNIFKDILLFLKLKPRVSPSLEKLLNSRGSTGGLIKRIDENRELLHLLQEKAPELLADCPWITGWIFANDSFFVQLDQLMPAKGRLPDHDFPREIWVSRENRIRNGHSLFVGVTGSGMTTTLRTVMASRTNKDVLERYSVEDIVGLETHHPVTSATNVGGNVSTSTQRSI